MCPQKGTLGTTVAGAKIRVSRENKVEEPGPHPRSTMGTLLRRSVQREKTLETNKGCPWGQFALRPYLIAEAAKRVTLGAVRTRCDAAWAFLEPRLFRENPKMHGFWGIHRRSVEKLLKHKAPSRAEMCKLPQASPISAMAHLS